MNLNRKVSNSEEALKQDNASIVCSAKPSIKSIICKKWEAIGVADSLLSWIKSYVTSAVLQGSLTWKMIDIEDDNKIQNLMQEKFERFYFIANKQILP